MASFWTEDKYRNQFLCAICGGPFARVFRTDVQIPDSVRASDEHGVTLDDVPSPDEFSVPVERNEVVTYEKAYKVLSARARLEYDTQDYYKNAFVDLRLAKIRHAYDGTKITSQDMRWTHIMRALIHRGAWEQPEGGPDQLADDQWTYITGRGTVRQDASWADAYPSIEAELDPEDAEEGDQPGIPEFDDTGFGFHMYEEPDRVDRKFCIGSIPFHDECWDLLDLALSVCGNRRGIASMTVGEDISTDNLWSYLRDLIPSSCTPRKSELTTVSLRNQTLADPITRLSVGIMGGAGYREAQLCGDGQKWLHIEGLHWLAVSPANTPLLHEPLPAEGTSSSNSPTGDVGSNDSTLTYKKSRTRDPFWELPQEIIVEIIGYLTPLETGRLRMASVPVGAVQVPQKEFRRFITEEMAYLPKLLKETELYSSSDDPQIEWKIVYERISKEWRTSDSLRNRRRIWKIVEPMADELVETSARNLEVTFELSEKMAERTAVVRGHVGVRSGAEGCRQTTMLTTPSPRTDDAPSIFQGSSGSISGDESSSSSASSDSRSWVTAADFVRAFMSANVWLDPETGNVCGFELLPEPRLPGQWERGKRFGRQTSVSETYDLEYDLESIRSPLLTGFIICWSRGCLQGLRLVFEDASSPVDEYARGEFYSRCFGNWNGPVRRLVAPRKYRILAGFTGFINSFGHIETFAILEEKPVGIRYNAPLSVPLSHQEASLWKEIPPNDVEIKEREGPAVGDWRTRTAECEVFEPTLQSIPPGTLKRISGFSDGRHLTGLRFLYQKNNGSRVVRDIGKCCGENITNFMIRTGTVISAVVLGYGDMGIHSLQMVTPSDDPGPAFGERYLGQQKVYAPEPPEHEKQTSAQWEYLKSAVIGFHCIYDPTLKWIVQLGIICRPSGPFPPSPPPSSNTSVFGVPSLYPTYSSPGLLIPFADTDNHSNSWVDGPPPSNFISGLKRSGRHKTMRVEPLAKFAGWVSFLDPISSVTIYGDMDGIRFRYFDQSRSDHYFGSTKETAVKETYDFTNPRKRISCIALQDTGIKHEDTRPFSELQKLLFLTNEQSRQRVLWIEVESEYLCGIKFSFTADRITDWDPLFNPDIVPAAERDNFTAQTQCPWKSPSCLRIRPSVEASEPLPPSNRVLADFFDHHGQEGKVDGVKGYVSGGQFCGLRFRRGGSWDVEPLGQASAYETLFLLNPDEVFTSISVLYRLSFGEGGALALCTSHGRTTPWIGRTTNGTVVSKSPPRGRKAVGIYMAFSNPDNCTSIGILHEKSQSRVLQQVPPKALDKTSFEKDETTGLDWACDPKDLPSDYRFCTDVEVEEYPEEPAAQRAYSLLSPEHLEKLESYVNTVPGRYGLKALKFHGNPKMGVVILGDWQEEFARPTEGQTMCIQAAAASALTLVNADLFISQNDQHWDLYIAGGDGTVMGTCGPTSGDFACSQFLFGNLVHHRLYCFTRSCE
ncbi:MAG: hypothetical protein M1840_004878 [Geoglossum simile]|nr:MAG: hypothetical protein M1840_004878 [Geoglossum simile]